MQSELTLLMPPDGRQQVVAQGTYLTLVTEGEGSCLTIRIGNHEVLHIDLEVAKGGRLLLAIRDYRAVSHNDQVARDGVNEHPDLRIDLTNSVVIIEQNCPSAHPSAIGSRAANYERVAALSERPGD